MPKVTIEVPEGFEEVVRFLELTLQRAALGMDGTKGDLAAFDAVWQALHSDIDTAERQVAERYLHVVEPEDP
ncbi:hypothetical protein [Hyalangium rubrum]|uniref:Uncharacterized protein n=1 Tax=Hyalangium rubrum TaxID=3103134 RepID=A0ABU5HK64_9BACT|nr:hypothetical protein [Hyalangium sp. s54d21]MDY7233309.1 hypothetical protein [Hyalangium sp. s54d21]